MTGQLYLRPRLSHVNDTQFDLGGISVRAVVIIHVPTTNQL